VLSYRKSGTPDSGWVVLDFVDAVVHVFSSEARAYYDLETLWKDAKRVPFGKDRPT
jgi:ribosome-associated protein